MKSLKFAPSLVPLVISGEKYVSWRINDDKDFKTGDHFECIKRPQLKVFGHGVVTECYSKPFHQFGEAEFTGHEPFNSTEEMHQTYSGYYNMVVNGDTVVKVIKFKFSAI